MNRRGVLLVRGMRWRLGASLLTVLAATIAVATAVLGPLYLHTAGDSVVRRTVGEAPTPATGLTLPADTTQGNAYGRVVRDATLALGVGGRHGFYGTPIYSTSDNSGAYGPRHTAYAFQLVYRSAVCRELHFVAGRCRLGHDDAVVSARSARRLGVSVGSSISGGAPVKGTIRHRGSTFTVTGIYALPDVSAPYWFGEGTSIFAYGQPDPTGPPILDSLFVSRATAEAVVVAAATTGKPLGHAAVAQLPLRPGRVDLAREGALERDLARIVSRSRALGIIPATQLQSVLASADHQRHQMATIVAVAAVQLVLLAVWVLTSLLVRSAEARQAEARAARLRGFPTVSMLWVTAAEPGLLCLVGVVLGVAIAWATVVVARASLLARSSSISFDAWAFAALALTVVAIAAALGSGSARLLRSTRLSQDTASRGAGSLAGRVVDLVLVMLALAALVALATTGALSGHANPLAAAAPGLIALGAAVIAVQGILLACRIGIARSGDSSRIAAFLALRQTARRPGLLRQARVLVIALGLACFATAAWSVARSNRASAAGFQVGARTVVTVARRSPTALAQSVDRLDPRGRFAMAAVNVQAPSSSLLAVDARRLTAAASWPPGLSAERLARIARAIAPATAPEVTLPSTPVHVAATVSATGAVRARLRDIDLDLWVENATTGTSIIQLGALHTGHRTYVTPSGATGLSAACPGGCRLDGVGVTAPSGRQAPGHGAVSVTIAHLATGTRTLPADLIAGDWRSSGGGVGATVHGGSLTFAVPAAAIVADDGATGGITPPMAAVTDHPGTLPAVATHELESVNASAATGTLPTAGLDGTAIDVRPVAAVAGLPRIGTNAVMVDLGLLSRIQLTPTSGVSSEEVWLGPHTPAHILGRLRAAGLDPVGVQRASAVLAAMQRTGPALADDFLLVAAIAALLVAAASTLSALGATTRERATELTSLRVAGVPRPTLARALAFEAAILLVTALCGAGAGILAAVLALPSLPERATGSLAPLQFPLPLGPIALVTVAVLTAVALAAGGIALTLLTRMSPMLLRTAPDDVSV